MVVVLLSPSVLLHNFNTAAILIDYSCMCYIHFTLTLHFPSLIPYSWFHAGGRGQLLFGPDMGVVTTATEAEIQYARSNAALWYGLRYAVFRQRA